MEAAARSGAPTPARLRSPGCRLGRSQRAPVPSAALARCRGLLASGEEAIGHFESALAADDQDTRPLERARIQLLLGETLRRYRQRVRARVHLRNAIETFERLGAAPWADRARSELRASGESTARETRQSVEHLTPQELQIAQYAADGDSNAEIAAKLFLSRRTVEYHLAKVYTKAGVTSRRELASTALVGLVSRIRMVVPADVPLDRRPLRQSAASQQKGPADVRYDRPRRPDNPTTGWFLHPSYRPLYIVLGLLHPHEATPSWATRPTCSSVCTSRSSSSSPGLAYVLVAPCRGRRQSRRHSCSSPDPSLHGGPTRPSTRSSGSRGASPAEAANDLPAQYQTGAGRGLIDELISGDADPRGLILYWEAGLLWLAVALAVTAALPPHRTRRRPGPAWRSVP